MQALKVSSYLLAQIASAALNIEIELEDNSGIVWSGAMLSPLVDGRTYLKTQVSKLEIGERFSKCPSSCGGIW